MSGAENLIPQFKKNTTQIETFTRDGFTITRFRPRTEGLFARIERWVDANGDTQWRAITKENITSIYGRTKEARIFDPDNEKHVYEWLLQETFDAKGNHILYEYAKDNQNLSFNKIYEETQVLPALHTRKILQSPDLGDACGRAIEELKLNIIADISLRPTHDLGKITRILDDLYKIRNRGILEETIEKVEDIFNSRPDPGNIDPSPIEETVAVGLAKDRAIMKGPTIGEDFN
jgi:hypothetical protein